MRKPKPTHRARLACFMHAASVNPEPGSNSPKKRCSPLARGQLQTFRRGLRGTRFQRRDPRTFAESRLHSSNVKDLSRSHAEVVGNSTVRVLAGTAPPGQPADCTAPAPSRQLGGAQTTAPHPSRRDHTRSDSRDNSG